MCASVSENYKYSSKHTYYEKVFSWKRKSLSELRDKSVAASFMMCILAKHKIFGGKFNSYQLLS